MGQRNEYHLALKEETVEGVDSVPTASDILSLIEPPTINPSITSSEARPAPGTQARQRSVAQRSEKSFAGAVYLVGTRQAATLTTPNAPTVGKVFKLGGMRQGNPVAVHYTVILEAGHTGVFLYGEQVTWAGGGLGIARTFAVPRTGAQVMLVIEDGGTPAPSVGDTLTGGTSTAMGTVVSINERTVYEYTPTSRQTLFVTATHANWTAASPQVGDVLVACNGTASAQVSGYPAASGVIVGVTGSGASPRVFEVDMIYPGTLGFAVSRAVTYVAATTGAIYTPANNTAPVVSAVAVGSGASFSADIRAPAMRQRVLGARGTFGLQGEAGGPMRVTFDARGTMETHQSGTLFSNPTFDDPASVPRLELSAVLVNGWPLAGNAFEYGHNAELEPKPDYGGPGGIRATRRTGRDPKFSLDPELLSPLQLDPFQLLKTGANVALAAQIGFEASNTFVCIVDYGQITTASFGERSGEIVANIEISCRRDPNNVDRDVVIRAY